MSKERMVMRNGIITQVGKHKIGGRHKVGGVDHEIEGFTKGGNKILRGPDNIRRIEKLPDDQLNVRVIIEITGNLRRADLDRFAQSMSKTVAFEFEDGGGGQ
jgi:hypothetical protein